MTARSLGSRFAIALFSLLAIFLLSRPASAITISPILFDADMDPGQVKQGSINVQNDTNQVQTYYASTQNFVGKGEEGQQEFLVEKDVTGLAQWIKLEKDSVTLEPGKSHEFKWAIELPKNAEPGGHYAAVFFAMQPKDDNGSNVGIGGRTGVLFLVNVSGNIRESASIESFKLMNSSDTEKAKSTSLINNLPAYFETRMKNSGSVHLKLEGNVVIKNIFGSTVGTVPANPANGRVLPDGIRKYRTMWGPKDTVEGDGFMAGLKREWKGFALGKYTAELDAKYGSQQQPLKASVSFWVFPWRIMLLAFGLLVILIAGLKIYNKMIIKSAMSKSSK